MYIQIQSLTSSSPISSSTIASDLGGRRRSGRTIFRRRKRGEALDEVEEETSRKTLAVVETSDFERGTGPATTSAKKSGPGMTWTDSKKMYRMISRYETRKDRHQAACKGDCNLELNHLLYTKKPTYQDRLQIHSRGIGRLPDNMTWQRTPISEHDISIFKQRATNFLGDRLVNRLVSKEN